MMVQEIRPPVYLGNTFVGEEEGSFRALSRGWQWGCYGVYKSPLDPGTGVLQFPLKDRVRPVKGRDKTPVSRFR